MDARLCHIIPIAAPTEEERAQPYLWRFWRNLPRRGRVAIFDRSWYGRVLVERVEGFCAEADWMRAYGEINDFEEQLVDSGGIIAQVLAAHQPGGAARRFKERQKSAFKRFKITDEDWRNREKWDAYEAAVCDMLDRTSTEIAPWTLVESEDKYFGRIKILRTLCQRIEENLPVNLPAPPGNSGAAARRPKDLSVSASSESPPCSASPSRCGSGSLPALAQDAPAPQIAAHDDRPRGGWRNASSSPTTRKPGSARSPPGSIPSWPPGAGPPRDARRAFFDALDRPETSAEGLQALHRNMTELAFEQLMEARTLRLETRAVLDPGTAGNGGPDGRPQGGHARPAARAGSTASLRVLSV